MYWLVLGMQSVTCFTSIDRWKLQLVENGCVYQLFEVKDTSVLRKAMDIIVIVVAEGEHIYLPYLHLHKILLSRAASKMVKY